MTNTKRTLFLSVVSMFLCVAMLAGTTFAWFTDSVESTGNIIKTGTLEVTMEWADGTKAVPAVDSAEWTDASAGAIFNWDKWEPGYTEVRHIKIANEGNLALKYQISIVPTGTVSKLADVIDVYYADPAVQVAERTALTSANRLATLTEAIAGMGTSASGNLAAGEKHTVTIALKMQESAGNEYQNKAIGSDFKIRLLATQLTRESDSFDDQYDEDSEYPSTADVWDGTVDLTWYNDTDTEFMLSSAEELAGLAKLVDNGNTFEGKTIKLNSNIDLYSEDAGGNRISFDPIGYGYNTVFKGTFDGQYHTISNLYQNGWDLGLDYSTEGGGLFASVVDATIKDLTLDNAEIVMECIDMGAIVGYSYGNCTYENIIVQNSTIANYNRYTGGVVGEVNGTQTFKNVDVINTTVSALWGTYDASLGGIIGGKWGDAQLTFEDCDVSAKIDAFNDACSNYQYYNYRLAGMLIGMSEEVTNGEASASYLTCTNCTVTYGDWSNYTYCESESYGKGSYAAADEWKFKRVQEGYATDGVDPNHTHDTDESHEELLVFDQLFGGDKGVRGGKTHTGVTVIYNN
ncbi:MAG: hypothetical protein IJD67_06355 [Clostridia bacterium]|nr:hypothetical protein [Clostridia bacterium]